jgi:hypothetical protein
MDDVSSRLSEILGDPASMEKIKNLAAMFSSAKQQEEQAPAPPQRRASEQAPAAPAVDPDLMRSVMKLAPAFSRMRQEDDSTRLLHALRPFLSEKRRKKLDEALRLMQLARMLPYLKNSGLLQSFL